jgi:hypothetical protein
MRASHISFAQRICKLLKSFIGTGVLFLGKAYGNIVTSVDVAHVVADFTMEESFFPH